MTPRILFFSILIFFFTANSFGQTPESEVIRYETISVVEDGVTLSLPYAGGLNSPLYTEADLNNDGVQDLFIYDRTDNSGNYIFRNGPNDYFSGFELQKNLPALKGFALMYDYNCDDVPDLFTASASTDSTIVVYQGEFDTNNELSFTVAKEKLTTSNNQFLFSYYENIPSIVDIDNDGDLDILTFRSTAGKQIAFHKNLSMELYNSCDSLVFDLSTPCYGNFKDEGMIPLALNINPDSCGMMMPELITNRHGISSLLSFDNDDDGLYELMIGNEYYNTVTVLSNDGTPNAANFYKQDNAFPSATTPINIPSLPTPSMIDANMDGVGDLLISNRSSAASNNYACTKLYQRDETDSFDLVLDTFLVKNMIDSGEEATPVFIDYNQDGLIDLLIGSSGYFDPVTALDGTITAYNNIGTSTNPKFRLDSRNFENIKIYGYNNIAPAFGDLDGDGDEDMIIGDRSGKLHYFQNIAGANSPIDFTTAVENYEGINVGGNAIPQIIDLNRDGLLDLVIGAKAGYIVFYPNNGTTTNPVFDDPIIQLGGVDTRYPGQTTGFCAPVFSDFETPGEYLLYAGSESGYVFRYDDIEGNLSAGESFTELTNSFANIKIGNRSRIHLADIDADDKLEMVVANVRGGIGIYKFGEITPTINIKKEKNYSIVPNPSTNDFYITGPDLNEVVAIEIFSVDGKQILSDYNYVGNRISIQNLESMSTGLYFLEIQFPDKKISKKVVRANF